MKRAIVSVMVSLALALSVANTSWAQSSEEDKLIDIKLGNFSVNILQSVGGIFLLKGSSIVSSWIFGGSESPPTGLSAQDLAQIRSIVKGEVGNLLSDYQYAELKESIRILGLRLDDYKWSVWDDNWDEWTLESANEYSDIVISDLSFVKDPSINPKYWKAGSELMLAISLRLTVKTEMIYRNLRPEAMMASVAGEMKSMLTTMKKDHANWIDQTYPFTRDNCVEIRPGKIDCFAIDEVFRGTDFDEVYYRAKAYHTEKKFEPFGGSGSYNAFVSKLTQIIAGS